MHVQYVHELNIIKNKFLIQRTIYLKASYRTKIQITKHDYEMIKTLRYNLKARVSTALPISQFVSKNSPEKQRRDIIKCKYGYISDLKYVYEVPGNIF